MLTLVKKYELIVDSCGESQVLKKEILTLRLTVESTNHDLTLYALYPGLYNNKIIIKEYLTLEFDYYYNRYFMRNYFYKEIILTYLVEFDEGPREVDNTVIDNTLFYDGLNLDGNFLYSFLLFIFIQKQKEAKNYPINQCKPKEMYPINELNHIMNHVKRDENFMSSLREISDHVTISRNREDDCIFALLLFIFIKQGNVCNPAEISNKMFLSSIMKIQDYLIQKFNEDGIIYNIISYL